MILKTLLIFTIYGALMFAGGRIWQRDKEKAKQEELAAIRQRHFDQKA